MYILEFVLNSTGVIVTVVFQCCNRFSNTRSILRKSFYKCLNTLMTYCIYGTLVE